MENYTRGTRRDAELNKNIVIQGDQGKEPDKFNAIYGEIQCDFTDVQESNGDHEESDEMFRIADIQSDDNKKNARNVNNYCDVKQVEQLDEQKSKNVCDKMTEKNSVIQDVMGKCEV